MSSASDRLAAYLAAELAILGRQSYTIGDRSLTMADLSEVRRAITALQKEVAAETAGTSGRAGPRHMLCDFR
jgi:hypothetical protein